MHHSHPASASTVLPNIRNAKIMPIVIVYCFWCLCSLDYPCDLCESQIIIMRVLEAQFSVFFLQLPGVPVGNQFSQSVSQPIIDQAKKLILCNAVAEDRQLSQRVGGFAPVRLQTCMQPCSMRSHMCTSALASMLAHVYANVCSKLSLSQMAAGCS